MKVSMLKLLFVSLLSCSAFAGNAYRIKAEYSTKGSEPKQVMLIVKEGEKGTIETKKGSETSTFEVTPKKHDDDSVDLTFFFSESNGVTARPRIISKLNHTGEINVSDDFDNEIYKISALAEEIKI